MERAGRANHRAVSPASKAVTQGGPQPMSDGRFDWKSQPGGWSRLIRFPNRTLPQSNHPCERAFWTSDSFQLYGHGCGWKPSTVFRIFSRENSMRAPVGCRMELPMVFARDGMSRNIKWIIKEHVCRIRTGKPISGRLQNLRCIESFWPAVAPDSARTYGFVVLPNPSAQPVVRWFINPMPRR